MTVSGMAVAQAPLPVAEPAAPARTDNCAPMQQGPGSGSAASEGSGKGPGSEPLTDKLARSDGVLCPPAGVDPEIRAPAPDVGKMPVIPPPGSPGGDPTLRPK